MQIPMKRWRIHIIILLVTITVLCAVMLVVRPQLFTALGRIAQGQSPVQPLQVDVPRGRYPVKGIDVSRHNGHIDWKSVAADSVEFVFIKATEGVNHRDSMLLRHYEGARAAGLRTGFYHFFRFERGGVRQGRHLLNTVRNMDSSMPLVIDFETHTNNTDINYYLVIGRLRDMIAYLRRQHRRVMIYCNRREYETYIRGNFDNTDLWLASGREPDLGRNVRLWQHSHNGRVRGIGGAVDINTFNGTRTQFEAWADTLQCALPPLPASTQ